MNVSFFLLRLKRLFAVTLFFSRSTSSWKPKTSMSGGSVLEVSRSRKKFESSLTSHVGLLAPAFQVMTSASISMKSQNSTSCVCMSASKKSSRSVPSQRRSTLSVPKLATCNLSNFHRLDRSTTMPAMRSSWACQSFLTVHGEVVVSYT